ncbi:MAG: nucleoside-diphosphate kinase [Lentisphaerae bacterium]|nr:nucleoside-diphosphate kinase [Lentisphaerota bacterium]
MAKDLAFVLINPYTIAKSRTGGVIGRCIGRTDLNFVAARMFSPSLPLVKAYADSIRHSGAVERDPEIASMLADYVLRSYAPDSATGRPRRVMLLLFEGDRAVEKLRRVAGNPTVRSNTGETIRDTFGDFIRGENGDVVYFEPAVLVAPTRERAAAALSLWSKYSKTDGGIVATAADVPEGERVERTLVLIKPDSFRVPSARPGNIIDVLSISGLRIVGVKKTRMTVEQAERFYGPVRDSLEAKFSKIAGKRVAASLGREVGMEIPDDVMESISELLAPVFAQAQFEKIVEYMTGYRPSDCSSKEKCLFGSEECLAIVYEGVDAIEKIRSILGSTDPSKAQPGSVRREFGSNIMVNAAHASDSVESAVRELQIVDISQDTIQPCVARYYGNMLSRMEVLASAVPKARYKLARKIREQFSPRSNGGGQED